ncbi:hypothetical protein E4U61_003047 [Claviceps capensis]|nr:hypothetical protein E4U61_003047 [Claviceps capensis]
MPNESWREAFIVRGCPKLSGIETSQIAMKEDKAAESVPETQFTDSQAEHMIIDEVPTVSAR